MEKGEKTHKKERKDLYNASYLLKEVFRLTLPADEFHTLLFRMKKITNRKLIFDLLQAGNICF